MAKRPGDISDWRKDWDWADKDDGPASWDDEDVYEMDIDQLMLPKDAKGIKSLDMPANDKVADLDAMKDAFSELTFGKPIHELSPDELEELEILFKMEYGKKEGGRIGYAYGPDPTGVVSTGEGEDDLTTMEFMQDQGINYGPQASGINKDVFIEKVVEEFVKRKGRKPRSIEEIKEFYFKEMAGGSGGPQRVAYEPGNYDPIMVEEYEKYKYDMQEQKPGFPIMEIDEFIEMQRAPVAGGGLPGILGV